MTTKLNALSKERLLIPAYILDFPDPTSLPVYTAVSIVALAEAQASLLVLNTFALATWYSPKLILTHLIQSQAVGFAGLWVKYVNGDEEVIRFSDTLQFI